MFSVHSYIMLLDDFPIDLSVVLGNHVVGRFIPNLCKSTLYQKTPIATSITTKYGNDELFPCQFIVHTNYCSEIMLGPSICRMYPVCTSALQGFAETLVYNMYIASVWQQGMLLTQFD